MAKYQWEVSRKEAVFYGKNCNFQEIIILKCLQVKNKKIGGENLC